MSVLRLLDEFNFHASMAHSTGTALVLFFSPDCGTCRNVEQRLPSLVDPEVALFYVDVRQSIALTRQYEVFHLPALFLFKDGQYHAKLECVMTVDALRDAIASSLERPPEEEP